jgi:hypothetical protein
MLCLDRYTLRSMRKLILVLLMLFLPLQWTAALAADCCLRHDAAAGEHAAHQTATHDHGHAHHSPSDAKDGKPAGKLADKLGKAADCQSDCASCHAHHCAVVLPDLGKLTTLPAMGSADTPYVAGASSPVLDNLFRPPLSRLA